MQAMPLYPYPCVYYSITDYVLSSMYSDLSPPHQIYCLFSRTCSDE